MQVKRNWLISFLISSALEMLLPTYAFIFFSCRPIFDAITNPRPWDVTSLAFAVVMPAIYFFKWIIIGLIFYFSYKKAGVIFLSLSTLIIVYFTFTAISTTFSFPFTFKHYAMTLTFTTANAWYIITSTKLFKLNRKLKSELVEK